MIATLHAVKHMSVLVYSVASVDILILGAYSGKDTILFNFQYKQIVQKCNIMQH